MSAWTIYWFTRLDIIQAIIIGCVVLSVLAISISMIFRDDMEDETRIKIRRFCVPSLIVFLLLLIGVPNSKEFAAIYLIPKIVNNEKVQQIPNKGLDLLNAKLDQWLDDLRKEKEKK